MNWLPSTPATREGVAVAKKSSAKSERSVYERKQGALRPGAAADYLAISKRALAREFAAGNIAPRRHGRCLLYPIAELDRWLFELPEAQPSDVASPAHREGAADA